MPPAGGSATGGSDGGMPAEAQEQLARLREDYSKMTAAAEEAEQNGDGDAAEFKKMLASDIKDKIKELEEKYPQPAALPEAPVPPMGLMMPPPPPGVLPPLPVGPGGILPPPPLPPPGVSIQEWQRMMMMYNPDFAVNVTQQQALEYDQQKARNNTLEPEVIELAHHFNLSDRHARMLDEQLKKRHNTFDDDIAAMYEILKGAKNPADLLMVSIRWMAEGVFNGTKTPNPDVEKVAKKYKLDAPSACKLAEVLETREDTYMDLKKICSHLERSNRPSALVMMMLKDLKNGLPVEESTKAPAIGSYLHRQELDKQQKKSRSRGRGGRSRDRGRRSPSRRRNRSRSRNRSGGRGRSRSRHRDRSRSR